MSFKDQLDKGIIACEEEIDELRADHMCIERQISIYMRSINELEEQLDPIREKIEEKRRELKIYNDELELLQK